MTLRYAVTFEFDSRPPLTVQGIGAVCMDILLFLARVVVIQQRAVYQDRLATIGIRRA
jgi:hypothetical protein